MDPVYGNPKQIQVIGNWNVKLYSGEVLKDQRQGRNVIATNGLDFLASFLNSAAATASTFTMKYCAIGTDATAEAASNTALGTETERHTGTVSYVSSAIYRVTATFPSGTAGAIVEYGLFSSNTGGTMLSRDTEAVINKGVNDTLEVTVQYTLA